MIDSQAGSSDKDREKEGGGRENGREKRAREKEGGLAGVTKSAAGGDLKGVGLFEVRR